MNTPSPLEISRGRRQRSRTFNSAPLVTPEALFSIQFISKRGDNYGRSTISLKVAQVIIDSFTNLFTDESGNPALTCVPGGVLWQLPRVLCHFPGPKPAPPAIQVYHTNPESQLTDPFDFAEKMANDLAPTIQSSRHYYDQALNLYTGGDRFMSHTQLIGYLAQQAASTNEDPSPIELADQLAVIGTTVAWATFGPLSFLESGNEARKRDSS